jgi:hydrogenase expression/formation protein HypE
MKTLPPGKLDGDLLARLLARIELPPEVVVGPGVGHDVAVIDLGHDELLLAKTDPITFATDAIGYYLVAVNSNDLATSGGVPRWLLVTALLPETQTTEASVEDIFRQLRETCAGLGISLVGGHTEITTGLDRPILVGQMLGTVPRDQLVRPDGIQPGDAILLTKGIPLEGVALIAREKREELLHRGYEAGFVDRCAGLLFDPGLMVLPEARALCQALHPHALHDPTEGGLATGLWEMAEASGVGLRIESERIPVLPEGRQLCAEYGVDPLGLIASGSLLAAVAAEDVERALAACAALGVPCVQIGSATDAAAGVILVERGQPRALPRYDQDEITRVL